MNQLSKKKKLKIDDGSKKIIEMKKWGREVFGDIEFFCEEVLGRIRLMFSFCYDRFLLLQKNCRRELLFSFFCEMIMKDFLIFS